MNIQDLDILLTLLKEPFANQRVLVKQTGYSLGTVNKSLKNLVQRGYLTETMSPTELAQELCRSRKPRNAIILAAGIGMRMVPINLLVPKGLLEVKKEILIERLIRQLQEVGIQDITVVVGFMKERFAYLIDEYHVNLIINEAYASKNNLSSLALAADQISNTYILPADVWCRNNPFSSSELYSWYMVSDAPDKESNVRMNRKKELVEVSSGQCGNAMTGIACLLEQDAAVIRDALKSMSRSPAHDVDFWEATLYQNKKMIIFPRVIPAADFAEINTYEQLKELDSDSNHLRSDAIDTIADVFHTTTDQIVDISVLKKGMTNRSFLFSVDQSKYIMRIPGKGTQQLINREHEADVFHTISGLQICDDPVYIDPKRGYKITKYLDHIRVADPASEKDIRQCMQFLRAFHERHLQVDHTFDLFGQIRFYETLWNGNESTYKHYQDTRDHVLSLQDYIDRQQKDWCLTHIDAVPDNFLFYQEGGEEKLQLTDWEYSGMQDPHLDLAMWSIYSFYNKEQIDHLLDVYFEGNCDKATRIKIYCYVAAAGLLWSNWCEYKAALGVEFGEYAIRQYRYAVDFYKLVSSELE